MSHYNSLANEIRRTCDAADVSNIKATCEEIDDLYNLGRAAESSADVLKAKLDIAGDESKMLDPVPTAEIDAKESRIAAAARAEQAFLDAETDARSASAVLEKANQRALAAAKANNAAAEAANR